MKKYLTKEKLLKILKNNNSWLDDECKAIIVRIEDTLLAFSDNDVIGELKSINSFIEKGAFKVSRLDSSPRNIKEELEDIRKELQTWVNLQLNLQVQRGKVFSAESAKQNEMRGKVSIFRRIIIIILSLLAIIAVIFTVLRWHDKNSYTMVPEIIGCADFVIGIIFFIYEQRDDKKKSELHIKAREAVDSGDSELCEKFINNYTVKNNIASGCFSTVIDNSNNNIT